MIINKWIKITRMTFFNLKKVQYQVFLLSCEFLFEANNLDVSAFSVLGYFSVLRSPAFYRASILDAHKFPDLLFLKCT